MAFWSQAGAEPLRQYRWYINFGNSGDLGLDNIKYALKKVDKPKAKIGSIQHKYMNHFFNYPGRLEWEDINLTFAAVTQPSATKIIDNVLVLSGYGTPSQNPVVDTSQYATIGKEKFVSALGEFSLVQVDPDGEEIERWKIHRPFFTSVQYGSLDYSAEEIVEITCTVKYDWAELELVKSKEDDIVPGLAPNAGNRSV